MYRNAQSSDAPGRGRITSGLAIIPLLFITMLESLSRQIRSWCPEELLYVDDLALVNDIIKGLKGD